ncbi:MAG: extracellular solute-binding protein [Elusimicrobia bacterium]|nr:extracellular solute-binding protein [Elusimicrobiota bacterium]
MTEGLETVTKLWVLPNNGAPTKNVLEEELRDFLKTPSHPRVEISVFHPKTLWKNLIRALKKSETENLPDLVQIRGTWTGTLASLGLLQELQEPEFLKQLPLFHPAALPSCTLGASQGRLFALPWMMGLRHLFYRKDILKTFGLDPKKDLGTWEGFVEACRHIKKSCTPGSSLFPLAFPGCRETLTLADLAPCVWGFCGDFVHPQEHRSLLYRKETRRGFAAYLHLIVEGIQPLFGLGGLPYGNFFQGNFAFSLSGEIPKKTSLNPRHPDFCPAVPKNLGLAPYPLPSPNPTPLLEVQCLALVKKASTPSNALELLKVLLSPRMQNRYPQTLGRLPCLRESLAGELDRKPELQTIFQASIGRARSLPNFVASGAVEKIIEEALENILKAILKKEYSEKLLERELLHASAEIDYVVSLYD